MCGIAGILGLNPENPRILNTMLEKQHHRGPDARGTWIGKGIVLGHNRLSILDLSTEANQPMLSVCGRYTLVFNGEIYNYLELKSTLDYPFRTTSDSEVLIALYIKHGPSMLNLLNGMFAFAIWDQSERRLFAARDRFGVKPFYYTCKEGQFYFASEIKTLIAAGVSNVPNEVVWADYLVHGSYGYPEETFYKEITQLPGGCSLEMGANNPSPSIRPYYDFVSGVKNQTIYEDVQKLEEDYLELLLDSIRLRFRADVPVGFNVSGGLDSSTLLSLIAQVKQDQVQNIEAFTFYTGDERYDELPWVKDLVKKTGSPLNPILLKVEEVPDLIQKVAYFQDEPYGGFPTLAYSKIFEAARNKGILVLLDGQGMDEAWAGYDYYQTGSESLVQGVRGLPTRPGVLCPEFARLARRSKYPEPFEDALQNKQYRDLFYTKIPRALRFNDRISMMHGTELREPFLDFRLVEFGFAQKNEMKIKNGEGKWLVRKLVSHGMGEQAFTPKRALQTPQIEWMRKLLPKFVEDQIGVITSNTWFDYSKLSTEWETFHRGKTETSFYVWQWLNMVNILTFNQK